MSCTGGAAVRSEAAVLLLLFLLIGPAAPASPPASQPQPAPGPPPTTPGASSSAAPVESREEVRGNRLLFQEEIYPYQVVVPPGFKERPPGPALLLLHGSGGNGPAFSAPWKDLAAEQGILLVAPTVAYTRDIQPLVPALLRALLAEVKRSWRIDSRRVYLFGYSAGGIQALKAAMQDGDVLAAAAVFASVIFPGDERMAAHAVRKVPLALYIGDHDQFFSLAQARHTQDILQAAGFPLRYVELPGQDHEYLAVADHVNRDAWAFLSRYTLPDR